MVMYLRRSNEEQREQLGNALFYFVMESLEKTKVVENEMAKQSERVRRKKRVYSRK